MNLSVLSLNVCLGAFNKISELEFWTNNLSPDLFFVQECELTINNVNHVNLKDYTLFVKPLNTGEKARICLFVRTVKLDKVRVTISQKNRDDSCQNTRCFDYWTIQAL